MATRKAQYLPDDLSDIKANPIMYGLPEEAKDWDDDKIVDELSEFATAAKKTANWDTDEFSRWVLNDEGMYNTIINAAESATSVGDLAQAIEAMEFEIDGVDLNEVNYEEVAEDFEDHLPDAEDDDGEIASIDEIAESYINGNISWVKEQIGSIATFVLVQEKLREMGQDEESMARFSRQMSQASKKTASESASSIADAILNDDVTIGDWWRDEITSPAAGDTKLWIDIADELINKISAVKDRLLNESDTMASKKTASLAEELHGAKYVHYDEDTGLTYAWHGGTYVNIYTEDGTNVDAFSSFEDSSVEEVKKAIEDHIEYEKGLDAEDMATEASKKTADYQGWKNYETWSVALLLDNDQNLYQMVREWAEEAKAAGTEADDGSYSDGTMQLTDKLKEYVEENNPLAEDNSMYSQLLSGAISEVDFREIAQSIIDED